MRLSCGFSMAVMVIGMAVICGQLLELVSASSGLSQRALRMLSMLSVNSTNEEQVQNAIDNGEPVPSLNINSVRQVHIRSLEENMTFFMERSFNGQYFQLLGMLREDNEGLMYIIPINLKYISLPKSPSPTDLERLKNLTSDDLIMFPGRCDGYFYETEYGFFVGEWPSCETFPMEIVISIPFVMSCEEVTFQTPVGIRHLLVNSPVPIRMKPNKRYPLVNYSGGKVREYKNFCKKVKG